VRDIARCPSDRAARSTQALGIMKRGLIHWAFLAAMCLPQLCPAQDDFALTQEEISRRREIYQALSADITKPLIDADDEALKNRITRPTGPRRTNEKDFYPDRAKRAGVQGEVLLVYVLEATGRVSNVQILRSSGSKLLDPAAIQSIRHTAFARSVLLDGTPVRAFLTTRTLFQLANSSGEVTPNKSLERSRDD
jgi:TonB family protein